MIGWDYSNFWKIGQVILAGGNPYSIEISWYPPATTFFFVIFSLIPFTFSFALWTGINFILFLNQLRTLKSGLQGLVWFFYTPVIFVFLTGQLDIFFFWLLIWLPKGGWRAVFAGVLLTLKPQLAVIILPWYLLRWVNHEKALVIRWMALTGILHLLPLFFDPLIYNKWFDVLGQIKSEIIPLSSGLFSLVEINIPVVILVLISFVLILYGLSTNESTSRSALLFGFPFTRWYDSLLITGTVPVQFLVPYSWVVFILAYLVKSNIPLATLPLAALTWQLVSSSKRDHSTGISSSAP